MTSTGIHGYTNTMIYVSYPLTCGIKNIRTHYS